MLGVIGCSIQEVVEVKGKSLDEIELWAIIHGVQKLIKADDFDINACSENETVTPRTIVLLADGKVIFDFKDVDVQKLQFQSLLKHKQTKTKEQKMHLLFHSLALTILWCAEYNLDSFTPLEISDDLQNLLMEMCEKNIIDPDQLQSSFIDIQTTISSKTSFR